MDFFSSNYWDVENDKIKNGWDVGYVSTPLREYFDQLTDKNARILIPGAGAAWEAEYLYKLGFKHVFVLDFSKVIISKFQNRFPDFPVDHIFCEDFFNHEGKYDLIVEQTFFSSFFPSAREVFVDKISELLTKNGKFVGLLFNHEFSFDGPPFGATSAIYRLLFEPKFKFLHFATAYNSIKPRLGRELFVLLQKC